MNKKCNRLMVSVLLLFIVMTGCNDTMVNSSWRQQPVPDDGSGCGWGNSLYYSEKERLAFGVANDSEHIYLCLKILDRRTQMRVLRSGLTVWFDSTGGDDKNFGVRFPVGLQGQEVQPRRSEQLREGSFPMNENPEFLGMLQDGEILGSDGDVLERFSVLRSPGIEVSLRDSSGQLIYTLQVPLRSAGNVRYGIGSQPGTAIGVGIEGGEFVRDRMRKPRNEGEEITGEEGGRGHGGSMGGMRGGGGPSGGGSEEASQQPIKLWVKVQLAGLPTKQ